MRVSHEVVGHALKVSFEENLKGTCQVPSRLPVGFVVTVNPPIALGRRKAHAQRAGRLKERAERS